MEDNWTPNGKMRPETNIYGRRWRSSDGATGGVYYPFAPIPLDAYEVGVEWGDIVNQSDDVKIVHFSFPAMVRSAISRIARFWLVRRR